jgi:hypothetical protein
MTVILDTFDLLSESIGAGPDGSIGVFPYF